MIRSRLIESKQVGMLYHFTLLSHMIDIVTENCLGDASNKFTVVSLTRDKNFYRRTKIVPTECYFVIDGDKLSQRYKITPYQWDVRHVIPDWSKPRTTIEDQQEESVKGAICPISRYTIEIVIDELELESAIFDDEELITRVSRVVSKNPDELTAHDVVSWVSSRGYKVRLR